MKIKILLGCALAALSFNSSAQSWKTDFSIKGVQIANVVNSAGNTAGVLCHVASSSCDAYVVLNTSCEPDEYYPLMINSAIGAYPLRGKCMHLGETQMLIIDEFSSAISAFQSGGEIGFAIPMASGAFRVVRFSTIGATAAIASARKPSVKAPAPTKHRTVEML